jgi:hypothetical protein
LGHSGGDIPPQLRRQRYLWPNDHRWGLEGAQRRYQSIDDTIVQLFISPASVLITPVDRTELVTTTNGRRKGFLYREWVDNVLGRHRLGLGVFRAGQDKGPLQTLATKKHLGTERIV